MYQVIDTSTQRSVIENYPTARGARINGANHLGVPYAWTIAVEVEPEQPEVYIVPVDPSEATNCEACQ
jgi:hypothetical protein